MKKINFLFAFIFISVIGYSQLVKFGYGKSVDTPVEFEGGISIKKGDTLMVGKGSSNGEFLFINVPKGSYMVAASAGISNKKLILSEIKLDSDKKRGDTYNGLIKTSFAINYLIDLQNAIQANEIVGVNGKLFRQPENVNSNGQKSISDELIKLKELLDKGIINQDEYETSKKKLLEKY